MKNQPGKSRSQGLKALSDAIGNVLEPVLARRTGMTLDLIGAWPEIVGEEFSKTTRPEKIKWPRRASEDDAFEAANLVVACEAAVALFFQHEQAAILERVNVFFGFSAIGRISIVQKPVAEFSKSHKAVTTSLKPEEQAQLEALVEQIEDPKLRESLLKLGRGVLTKNTANKQRK